MFFSKADPQESSIAVMDAPVATDAYPFVLFDRNDPFSPYRGLDSRGGSRDPESHAFDSYDREMDQRARNCVKYLEASRAVKTPVEVFALWVELFERQGGQIKHVWKADFANNPSWMPTRHAGELIPTAYGATALHLVMVPHQIEQNMQATSGDSRSGWEYGHSTVHTFSPAKSGQVPLSCTNANMVYSYADVERLRREMSPRDLASRAVDILRQAHSL